MSFSRRTLTKVNQDQISNHDPISTPTNIKNSLFRALLDFSDLDSAVDSAFAYELQGSRFINSDC